VTVPCQPSTVDHCLVLIGPGAMLHHSFPNRIEARDMTHVDGVPGAVWLFGTQLWVGCQFACSQTTHSLTLGPPLHCTYRWYRTWQCWGGGSRPQGPTVCCATQGSRDCSSRQAVVIQWCGRGRGFCCCCCWWRHRRRHKQAEGSHNAGSRGREGQGRCTARGRCGGSSSQIQLQLNQ
jgi:hypothetical protein